MYLKKLKITSSVPNKWCVSGLGFSFALKNSKFSMYKWFPKIHLPFELNFNFLDRLDDNWVTVVSFLQSLWKCVIWIWEFEFNKILYMTVAELLWIPVAKILAQFDIIYPRYCLYLLLPELLPELPSLTLLKGGQNTVFVCFNTTCGENVSKTGLYLGE